MHRTSYPWLGSLQSLARLLAVIMTVTLIASCGSETKPSVHLIVAPENAELFAAFVAPIADTVFVEVADDPVTALRSGAGVRIAVVATSSGDGSYRMDANAHGYVVQGDAPLGVQYGTAHLLELLGFGFFHPFSTHVPSRFLTPSASEFGVDHTPDRAVRGIHMHTLHPIEGFFDFWEPGADHQARATLVVDWLVKNRGNYLQWPGLDEIQEDDTVRDAWAAHTNAIITTAHARGVRIGFGLQLFGESNLQGAYDLVEKDELNVSAAINSRLDIIADVPFDSVQLSFGEFLGADPPTFVAHLDTAVAAIRARWPLAEVSTVIHMGNYPNLEVSYMSETLNYYFLSKFAADPAVVPYVHTTMFYNLYEDAGGAYAYDEFTDHRVYLHERLAADQPVVYFPETAYWIAFDNSIPIYLPVYVRSRWHDLDRTRAAGVSGGFGGDDFGHVLFSSGWEWGYWQNDWATLRASYELPPTYEELFDEMFTPWGTKGGALADEVVALTDAQHEALIVNRLAPWMASRDWTFEAGDVLGIYSQPTRLSFAQIAALSPTDRATFRTNIVDRMGALADELEERRAAIEAIGLPAGDPFLDEIRDGVDVDVERARFVHALLRATLAHAEGDPQAAAFLAEATDAQARASVVIDRRHTNLHYPDAETIRSSFRANATSYNYGYLREAETRCFFDRERIEVSNLLTGASEFVPFCALL